MPFGEGHAILQFGSPDPTALHGFPSENMASIAQLLLAATAIVVLVSGFSYHLGWRHGWECGFAEGRHMQTNGQPRPKGPFSFIYGLGWHRGWDRGFRKAVRGQSKQNRTDV
jgi:hypothetical protein